MPALDAPVGGSSGVYTLSVESAEAPGAALRTATGPAVTARESTVLALVAAGWTNQEIASEPVVSVHTVKKHVQNLFRKFGVTNRTGLVAAAELSCRTRH